MVQAFTRGNLEEIAMKGSLRMMSQMEKEYTTIKTMTDMRDSLRIIKCKGREYITLEMEADIKGNGKKGNDTERELYTSEREAKRIHFLKMEKSLRSFIDLYADF